MAGAARFLYGLALGLSLGVIGSKLLGAASSGPNRRPQRRAQRSAIPTVSAENREKQESAVP